MDADVLAVRRWLLDEARSLQRQHEDLRRRLAAVRSLMRLVKAYEVATQSAAAEATS
jgi:hypothetical protein